MQIAIAKGTLMKGLPSIPRREDTSLSGARIDLGTMQNLISHFLLKNTVCLRVSASEMY